MNGDDHRDRIPGLRLPRATYRVQLTPDFGFADARRIVPYLDLLGISDLYCSPILAARPGSQHGYDVIDASRLNPELGSEAEFNELVAELRNHGMGLLLDIVPNHMAASTDNPWWVDVLENGRASPYAHYFDIEWDSAMAGGILQDRVLLPILGGPYGDVLEAGELQLVLDEEGLRLSYFDTILPVALESYAVVLKQGLSHLERSLPGSSSASNEYRGLIQAIEALPPRNSTEPDAIAEHRRVTNRVRQTLLRLRDDVPEIKRQLDHSIADINGRAGQPRSFDLLDGIISGQSYRLAFWQLARERINYRRFFDINDLVSMRVEEEEVFAATHRLILDLVRSGAVTGLRIDHIDGLRDPQGYLERLRRGIAGSSSSTPGGCQDFFVVAEKILAHAEQMPSAWAVCGTTGYDFLNEVAGLFIQRESAERLDALYHDVTGQPADFPELAYRMKRRVLSELFEAGVQSLTLSLDQLSELDRHGRDLTLDSLQQALIEVTACLPVYRTYIRDFSVRGEDRKYIEQAINDARARNPELGHALFFLRRLLLLQFPSYFPEEERDNWLDFVLRWQQFTGPAMAKGYEDTALYIYNRLIAQNEVGGHPELPGVAPREFHQRNRRTRDSWPHTLNASSTHDTKRSEDMRARLYPLSEIADEWMERVKRWRELNAAKRPIVDAEPIPDPNVELLVYQTLLGIWPLSETENDTLGDRLRAYLQKAAREAKVYTSWGNPNEEYEEALGAFAGKLLDPAISAEFLEDFHELQGRLACWGMLTSLSQTLLKLTSPGVPDIYQGTELWSLALVDPDNRRPVDFDLRDSLVKDLASLAATAAQCIELLDTWRDGRIKLYLICKTLRMRAELPDLFSFGEYVPLEVYGPRSSHVLAYARHLADTWCIVVTPRLFATLVPETELPIGESVWGDTYVELPQGAPEAWENLFDGATITAYEVAEQRVLLVQSLLRSFPVALAWTRETG